MFANSDEDYCILMLDFQSFYVNLVINLLESLNPDQQEAKVIKKLNEIRLDLKEKKDPNDIIFKIATLAYTGSLNQYSSPVFNSLLYYIIV